MSQRLSSEMVHATTVAKDGRGVVIAGRSGSGKSDLALRLIDRGFVLVSDDQTLISKADGKPIASAPGTIRGKIEVRGIGIVEVDHADRAAVCLWVTLTNEVKRLPEGESHIILGVAVPEISLDAMTASAPIKIELALGMIA
ncbi:aldolase [Sphingomonas sp.]|uniref:HPr kinase/phosphorylase n=1 Tax=Sphingomonas sp. TaxID=28214 RepID=UPI00286B4B1B|nr:aldolase [Sphingomonas sp.]